MRILLCPRAGQAIQKTRVGNGSDFSKFLIHKISASEPVFPKNQDGKDLFLLGDLWLEAFASIETYLFCLR